MTDWPNYWVNLVIALATLGAVGVAIYGTYLAREDAAAAKRELVTERARSAKDETSTIVRELAQRQAIHVKVSCSWLEPTPDDEFAPKSRLAWKVANGGPGLLVDVVLFICDNRHARGKQTYEYLKHPILLDAFQPHTATSGEKGQVLLDVENSERPTVELHFTDERGHRWHLTDGGNLYLEGLPHREIGVDPDIDPSLL